MRCLPYAVLLPFYFCHNIQTDLKCNDCILNNKCKRCAAFCYDESGSIFKNVNNTCKLLQSSYQANVYYWNKLAKKENVTIENLIKSMNDLGD